MSEITYDDKVDLQVATNIANINKVTASDMNEIKNVVNNNAEEVGDITSLTTTDKTSVVNAVNELNAPEKWVSVGATAPTDGRRVWLKKGKNLLKLNLITTPKTYSGVTFTPNNDGTITLNGTATGSRWVDLSNMIISSTSFNLGAVTNTTKSLTNNNYTLSAKLTNGQVNVSFNSTNNMTSCYLYANTTYNNAILQIQFEKGSIATTYEPYIEKSIKVDDEDFISMGDLVSVGVSQPSDGKRVWFAKSKNLINIDNINVKQYVNRFGGLANSNDWSATDYIQVQPNTTYTLSGITNSGTTAKTCFYSNQDVSGFISSINSTEYIFTTPNNANYVRLSLNSETPTSAMLEEGSTATTYEPYIEPSINVDGEQLHFDNYSYGEQIIGKWVDGKPLYRRVYQITNPSASNTDYVDVSSIGIYRLVHLYGYYKRDTGTFGIPFYDSNDNYSVMFLNSVNKLRGRFANASGITDVQVVIEYTKTTD